MMCPDDDTDKQIRPESTFVDENIDKPQRAC